MGFPQLLNKCPSLVSNNPHTPPPFSSTCLLMPSPISAQTTLPSRLATLSVLGAQLALASYPCPYFLPHLALSLLSPLESPQCCGPIAFWLLYGVPTLAPSPSRLLQERSPAALQAGQKDRVVGRAWAGRTA